MKWSFKTSKKAAKFYKQYGKFIRVGHTKYKIIFCKELTEMEPERHLMGLCVYDKKTIYVDVEKHDPHETLFHEIFHAYVEASGVRQTSSWSNDIEEILCEITSKTLLYNFNVKKRAKKH